MHYFCAMNELATHIHELLLESDFAIIPGFGGFIAHQVPAIRDAKNGLFIPPSRSIGFNDRLILNDGLLVQSYMSTYKISAEVAEKRINQDLDKLLNNLEDNGSVVLHQLGTIYCDADNKYSFKADEDFSTCPQLYGFKPFEMLEISQLQTNKVTPITSMTTSNTSNAFQRKAYNLVGSIAVIAVTVASFFMFSTPVKNTEIQATAQANIISADFFSMTATPIHNSNASKEQTAKTAEETAKNTIVYSHVTTQNKEIIAEQAIPVAEVETKSTTSAEVEVISKAHQADVINKAYHIIVASSIKESLANDLVSRLKDEGFSNAQVLKQQNLIRVSAESFDTKEAAYNSLNKISLLPEYTSAWVYKAN